MGSREVAATHVGMPDPAAVDRPWIDAYPPGVPPTYPIPHVALPRLLADAVRDFPTAPAIAFAGRRWTWGEVGLLVQRAAGLLAEAGVAVGDRVALVLPGVPAMAVAAFATWHLGASVVPVDPLADEVELERILDLAGCTVVVGASSDLDRLERLRDRPGPLRAVVATGVHRWLPRAQRVLYPIRARRSGAYRRVPVGTAVVDLDRALDTLAARAPAMRVEASAEAVVLVGAGRDHAVVLSHANLVAGAFQARLWLPDVRAGREGVLVALPLTSGQGLGLGLLTPTLVAGTMVMPHVGEELGELVARERPSLLVATTQGFRGLTGSTDADLTSLRICLATDGLLDADLVGAFEARTSGARLRQAHGSDEAGPLTHATPVYGRRMDGAIGLPVTSTTAIVVDPRRPSRRLGPGLVGELLVHGPQVSLERLDGPTGIGAPGNVRDGWLRTGDLVRQDASGVFELVGRLDDGGPRRAAPAAAGHAAGFDGADPPRARPGRFRRPGGRSVDVGDEEN